GGHRAGGAAAMPASVENETAREFRSPSLVVKSSDSPPARPNCKAMSGITTAVTKYAKPTHRNARMAPALGLPPPMVACPSCSTGTYTPQESTAPTTKAIHVSKLMCPPRLKHTCKRDDYGKPVEGIVAERLPLGVPSPPPQRRHHRRFQRGPDGQDRRQQTHSQHQNQQCRDPQPQYLRSHAQKMRRDGQ